MRPELKDGKLIITSDDGRTSLDVISSFIEYDGNDYNVIRYKKEASEENGLKLEGNTAEYGNVKVHFAQADGHGCDAVTFSTEITNDGEEILKKANVFALSFALGEDIDRATVNVAGCFYDRYLVDMMSPINTVRPVWNSVYDSGDTAVLKTEYNTYIVGALTCNRYYSGVRYTGEGIVSPYIRMDDRTIPCGKTVSTEKFVIIKCDEAQKGLEAYAEMVADEAGLGREQKEVPTGYCTWYYYAGNITSDTVRQNMKFIHDRKEKLPVKIMQIDDGWFDRFGYWDLNEKFSDMKELVEEINSNGYTAGLWFAPFAGNKQMAEEHPDWFVHTRDGEVNSRLELDYTNPEVCEYMTKVFRRATYDWGFRYLKLDHISFDLEDGVFHDPDATGIVNYKLGMKVIRDAVTPDTFILGCTTPLLASVGLVDGMRMSCDVFERWESIRDVFNEVFNRWYMSRWFIPDADCLMVRKKENEDSECWRLCTRTDDEIETFIIAMIASGGVLMLSDKMPNLSEKQIDMIARMFPVNTVPARPVDFMESYIPGDLRIDREDGTTERFFINWGNTTREFDLLLPYGKKVDIWDFKANRIVLRDEEGLLTVKVKPHCAVYVKYRS